MLEPSEKTDLDAFRNQKSTFAFTLENTQDWSEYEQKKADVIEFVNKTPTRDIFKSIFDEWLARPCDVSSYASQNEGYVAIMDKLRSDDRLGQLANYACGSAASNEPKAKGTHANHQAERLMVSEMMTLLENVWGSLDFQNNFLHPVHEGWLNIFQRWTSGPVFEHHWFNEAKEYKTGIQSDFSPSFQRFVETIRRLKRTAKNRN